MLMIRKIRCNLPGFYLIFFIFIGLGFSILGSWLGTQTVNLNFAKTQAIQPFNYTTSWLGNTYGGKDNKWVQMNFTSIFVTPDGTVYSNSVWDEGERESGIYKNGEIVGKLANTHGWGILGGKAITANSTYVYMAVSQDGCDGGDTNLNSNGLRRFPDCDKSKIWYGVRRYQKSSHTPSSFTTGYGTDGSQLIVNIGQGDLTGLAATETRLYVSDYPNNQIKVYDANTMQPVTSWSVTKPGQLALDKNGNLWVVQKEIGQLLRYSPTGQLLPQKITSIAQPYAIAVDNQNRLLIGDLGLDHQIKIFSNLDTSPIQTDTFGEKGGIFAGSNPGEIRDKAFFAISGIGVDVNNNIYVSTNAEALTNDRNTNRRTVSNNTLQSYNSDQILNWKLQGLLFVDNADADLSKDAQEVYTKGYKFELNYALPPGQQWKLKAYTLNPYKYPDDIRLEHYMDATWIRNIGDRKLMFVNNQYGNAQPIYRFNSQTDGEIAIPAGGFLKGKRVNNIDRLVYWQDKNGNGVRDEGEIIDLNLTVPDHTVWVWWVDNQGNVWVPTETTGITKFPLKGFDSYGSPIYAIENRQSFVMPAEFKNIQRIEYIAETDTMYISGYESQDFNREKATGTIGTKIVKYINWSSSPQVAAQFAIPYDLDSNPRVLPKSISVAGDYLFVGYVFSSHVIVFDNRTGRQVSTLTPGAEVGNMSGWLDIPFSVRAVQRSNGQYLVFVEEVARSKVIIYQFN
jgi:hypothetical protein